MMRSEIALWPHPAHNVVFVPRYSFATSPILLTFFRSSGGATLATVSSLFPNAAYSPPTPALRGSRTGCAPAFSTR